VHIFTVIFMYGLWSSVFSLGKLALENSPPVFLTAVRMTLAGLLLVGFIVFKNKSQFRLRKNHLVPILALSILSIYLTNILEFWGLQHLSAAKTCFIYSLSPFFAAIFSYIHFGEKMNAQKSIGMFIGFLGFIPTILMQTENETFYQAFGIFSWPELAIVGAAFFSVYGWVVLRIIVKKQTISPLFANGYSMLFGGLIALVHSLFSDTWNPIPVTISNLKPFLYGILLMTLVSNIICYNIYGFMLKKFTATFLSFMGLLSPIFASLNSWIILNEPPSWQILLSTSIVCLGLFIVYQAELKQGYITKDNKLEPKSA